MYVCKSSALPLSSTIAIPSVKLMVFYFLTAKALTHCVKVPSKCNVCIATMCGHYFCGVVEDYSQPTTSTQDKRQPIFYVTCTNI